MKAIIIGIVIALLMSGYGLLLQNLIIIPNQAKILKTIKEMPPFTKKPKVKKYMHNITITE